MNPVRHIKGEGRAGPTGGIAISNTSVVRLVG
jgi:hypothetical protein